MRAAGHSWVEIAEDFQRRYLVNARKALRWAHGWSQDEVAAAWCRRWPDEPRTGQNISTWERWPVSGHEPSVGTLVRLAELYECDVADLVGDLGCFRHLDDATAPGEAAALLGTSRRGLAPVVPLNREAGHMETSRRMFAAGAVAAAIGLAEPFRGLLTRPVSARPVIGPDHVTALEGAIQQIEAQDATVDRRAHV